MYFIKLDIRIIVYRRQFDRKDNWLHVKRDDNTLVRKFLDLLTIFFYFSSSHSHCYFYSIQFLIIDTWPLLIIAQGITKLRRTAPELCIGRTMFVSNIGRLIHNDPDIDPAVWLLATVKLSPIEWHHQCKVVWSKMVLFIRICNGLASNPVIVIAGVSLDSCWLLSLSMSSSIRRLR